MRGFLRSARFHLVMIYAWAVLVVPSLTLLAHSVPWLEFMSVYAIITGHWSGYQGARAERTAGERALPRRSHVAGPGGARPAGAW